MTDIHQVPLVEDPLAEALHFLRMDGTFYCQFEVPHEHIRRQFAIMRHGDGGDPTRNLCGVAQIGSPAARVLVDHLPEIIVVNAQTSGAGWVWFPNLLALMANETRSARPGGETIVTRSCDILVIQSIRAWIENEPVSHGWLAAPRDPLIGHAITLVHRDPARDWTVALLAAESAMSRSAFSACFTELVGESPKQYVANWRMHLARSMLQHHGLSVLETATRLGYRSEPSLSRAIKRVTGIPPSAAGNSSERSW